MQGLFRGRPRVVTAILTVGAVGALALPSASAAPSHGSASADQAQTASAATVSSRAGTMTTKIRGTFGKAGVVRGHFDPVRFIVKHGDAFAYGVAHTTLVRGNGHVVGHATKRIVIPVKRGAPPASAARAAATCDVLNLVLGPLDLNLLGLKVHLNKVVLNIVAVSGAGNLLGNLLCAVAGLLDQTGLLGTLKLSNTLNRILNVLRLA